MTNLPVTSGASDPARRAAASAASAPPWAAVHFERAAEEAARNHPSATQYDRNAPINRLHRLAAAFVNSPFGQRFGEFLLGPAARDPANPTPTVGQFATAGLLAFSPEMNPPGMRPFLSSSGGQMRVLNMNRGLSGAAWVTPQGHVLVSFMGSNPLASYGRRFNAGQVQTNIGIYEQLITPTHEQAADFVRDVQKEAWARGIDPLRGVFVTGISLGGAMAGYSAQQTGVGGFGIVSPGLPSRSENTGENYVNFLVMGDPVSMHTREIDGNPHSTTTNMRHHGHAIWTGRPEAVQNNRLLMTDAMSRRLPPEDLREAPISADPTRSQRLFRASSAFHHTIAPIPGILRNFNLTLPQLLAQGG